jgi:DNA-binding MltR family transcriptional regulator
MVWAIGNPTQDVALRELIRSESSDRIVAIIGGAILEDSLKEAMTSRFRSTSGHSADVNEKLFRVGGPLGNLQPKIDLGYQLYMFEKPLRNAMYGVAEIRNLFAHQLNMTFESTDKKIVEATKKFTLHEGRTHYPVPWNDKQNLEYEIEPTNSARDKFIVNLKLCLSWLMVDGTRHQMNSNVPLTWGPMTS